METSLLYTTMLLLSTFFVWFSEKRIYLIIAFMILVVPFIINYGRGMDYFNYFFCIIILFLTRQVLLDSCVFILDIEKRSFFELIS